MPLYQGGGEKLSTLSDVKITSVNNGDVITWNSSDDLWENQAGGGGGGAWTSAGGFTYLNNLSNIVSIGGNSDDGSTYQLQLSGNISFQGLIGLGYMDSYGMPVFINIDNNNTNGPVYGFVDGYDNLCGYVSYPQLGGQTFAQFITNNGGPFVFSDNTNGGTLNSNGIFINKTKSSNPIADDGSGASMQTDGDLSFIHNSAVGPILADRSNGHTYRIKCTGGILSTEVVT